MLLLLVGFRVYEFHLFVESGNYIFSRSTLEFIYLLITVGLISAAGYLVNDIVDVEVDKINKPNKKLAFSKNVLWGIYVLMNSLAIGLSMILINELGLTFIILISAIILLLLYSILFQKLPLIGNLVVSSLAGVLPVLYHDFDTILITGHANVSLGISYQYIIISYMTFGFIISLFRELIKDIEDIKGDKKGGYKTLAVIVGVDVLKRYLMAFMFLFSLVLGVIVMMSNFSFDLILFLSVLFFYILSMIKVYKNDFTKASLFLKLTLFSGVLILFVL